MNQSLRYKRVVLMIIALIGFPLMSVATSIGSAQAQDTKNLLPSQADRVSILLVSMVQLEEFVILQTGKEWIVVNSHGQQSKYRAEEIFSVTYNGVDITSNFPELDAMARKSNMSDLQFILVRQAILFTLIGVGVYFWQSAQIGS